MATAKLNTTREGKPAEIDIWKVDFSKLKSWPTTDELSDNPPNKVVKYAQAFGLLSIYIHFRCYDDEDNIVDSFRKKYRSHIMLFLIIWV